MTGGYIQLRRRRHAPPQPGGGFRRERDRDPPGGRVEVILTALVDDCRPVVFLRSHGVALADDEFVPLARLAGHTDSRDGSPYRSHWIVLNLVVRRQQGQAVRDRLTNQHPVEGIVVVLG